MSYMPRKQKKQSNTHTFSLVPGRARAGAARYGRIHPLCTPAPIPTAKPGPETPQRVSGTARPTRISTLLIINNALLDSGERTARTARTTLLLLSTGGDVAPLPCPKLWIHYEYCSY